MELGLYQKDDEKMFINAMFFKKQTICRPKRLRVVCVVQSKDHLQTL